MKKIILIFLLIYFGFLLSCSAQAQPKGESKASTAAPKKISAAQAKDIMDKGEPYTLVDVRTVGEFNERHIKGAILIPVDEIESRAEKELPDRDAVILVYCRSGVRSARAAQSLAGMGYTNVYDMGGIMNWPYDRARN